MRQAFRDFSELLLRFPDSNYAADSQKRMISIRNRLAAYELHAARYYIKRQAYLAAVNRAAQVVKEFPSTPNLTLALLRPHEGVVELSSHGVVDAVLLRGAGETDEADRVDGPLLDEGGCGAVAALREEAGGEIAGQTEGSHDGSFRSGSGSFLSGADYFRI